MTFWRVFIIALLGGAVARSETLQQLAAWVFVALVGWLFASREDASRIDEAVDRGLERFAKRYRK